ncbi:MAG TPA: hypothetical protein VNG33_01415 [Polyangiaceae bacterium]|nr:hypothetical protein [Polyangiaceae bacterium]
MSQRSGFLLACLTVVSLGCGGVESLRAHSGPQRPPSHAARAAVASAPLPLTAHRFAEVSDVVGPYVGRDGDLSLAAWAEAASSGRILFATAITPSGVPSKPARIGNLAPELDLVLVRGFGAASAKTAGHPRFAVVTTRRAEQKTQIDVTALSADAAPVWGPTVLAERAARVLWVGFVVASDTPLLLWAEQAIGAKAGEAAALYGLPVSVDGKAVPALISSKACVWQVAAVAGQAALAAVKPGASGCSVGSVTLDLLGATGKSEKSIELGGRAALDLDLVASPDAFVLAWSDREQLEPRAFTAIVDAHGVVRSPAGATVPALGEQAVVALAAGASPETPAFLVWENVTDRPENAHFLEISALNRAGRASGVHSRLLYGKVDGGTPELTSFGGGVAALTLAPACASDESCEGSLPVPTFVAFDAALKVQASQPLVLDTLGGRAADLGWGLTCQGNSCFALAAPSRSPATLFTVPLPLRASLYRPAAEESAPSQKPRVVASDVLLRAGAPLSQIASCDLTGRNLIGYVTDFDPTTPWQKLTKPAEDGRLEPLRARVALRAFAADGARAPLAEEQAVSLRAHSLGGLSLLTDSPTTSKDALALWTGLDKGEPQVFLTFVGADGKRGQQRMLTRKSGEASDVAGLTVDGGYLVAWVDERSGDAEVYATRVSRTLEKGSPEQRITTADGAASELLLTRVAGRPYAVWADARAAEEPGWADIYGAFLRPSDAARDGGEHRLSSTRPHSFAPKVADLGGTPVLAWLEEAADQAPASVRIATLSSSGELSGSVSVVPINAGAPRGLGLACKDVSCRLAVTVEADGRGELYGFEWRPAAEAHATRLSGLGSPGAAAVGPLVRGDTIYVADAHDGQGLVRRLGIEW